MGINNDVFILGMGIEPHEALAFALGLLSAVVLVLAVGWFIWLAQAGGKVQRLVTKWLDADNTELQQAAYRDHLTKN